MNNIRFTYE